MPDMEAVCFCTFSIPEVIIVWTDGGRMGSHAVYLFKSLDVFITQLLSLAFLRTTCQRLAVRWGRSCGAKDSLSYDGFIYSNLLTANNIF